MFEKTNGFYNVTSLALMPYFDLVMGIVPDYMHGVLLGITKTLMYNWFSATKTKKPYFIGKEVCTGLCDTLLYNNKQFTAIINVIMLYWVGKLRYICTILQKLFLKYPMVLNSCAPAINI